MDNDKYINIIVSIFLGILVIFFFWFFYETPLIILNSKNKQN